MGSLLQLLIVEDSESDSLLLQCALRKERLTIQARRVETAAEMKTALAKQAWDAVLCDARLPSFDAEAALAVYHARGLDIPCKKMNSEITSLAE